MFLTNGTMFFLSILSNDNRDKKLFKWHIRKLYNVFKCMQHVDVGPSECSMTMLPMRSPHCGVLSFIRIIILIGIYSKTLFVNETVHERIRIRKMNAPTNQSAFIVMIAYACASLYTFMIVVQLEWRMTQSLSRMCIREVNVTLKLISRACRLS